MLQVYRYCIYTELAYTGSRDREDGLNETAAKNDWASIDGIYYLYGSILAFFVLFNIMDCEAETEQDPQKKSNITYQTKLKDFQKICCVFIGNCS